MLLFLFNASKAHPSAPIPTSPTRPLHRIVSFWWDTTARSYTPCLEWYFLKALEAFLSYPRFLYDFRSCKYRRLIATGSFRNAASKPHSLPCLKDGTYSFTWNPNRAQISAANVDWRVRPIRYRGSNLAWPTARKTRKTTDLCRCIAHYIRLLHLFPRTPTSNRIGKSPTIM